MKQIRQLSKKGVLPMLAIAILYPLIMGAFHQSYLILLGSYAMLYIIVVSGIDVLFGYSGQITMGHAGFYAIGAYGTAIIHNYLNLPPMLSIQSSSVRKNRRRLRAPESFWTLSASETGKTSWPAVCPTANSAFWRSLVRWPASRSSCCSTSPRPA